jgi:hypothetical protein
MILLIKLLLSHLIGDFVLQPDAWVRDKELRKQRSRKLYFHVLLHGVLAWLLVFDISFWLPAIIIVLTHFVIDLTKIRLQKAENRTIWFVLDQSLHVTVLVAIWIIYETPDLSIGALQYQNTLIVLTAALFLTSPSSTIIKTTISHWTPDTFYTVSSSLPDAGKFIGYLERVMVFTFILYGRWEAVGFLLAAKSVFRFGNLKESHDRKLTEYVLIGTLLSFGIAIAIALLSSALIGQPVE